MSESAGVSRISAAPETLTVEWADGARSEYSSLWLRDNVSEDRDAYSGQRLIDIADLPAKPRIRNAVRVDGAVRIDWDGEARTASLIFDGSMSIARKPEPRARNCRCARGSGQRLDARRDFAWASLAALSAVPSARLAWLTRLVQDGLAFLEEVPAREGAILEVMPLVGRVLETNYGLTFDVRSVAQPENLAYSDLGLGLHTDNPYREPVPGFQALHALVTSDEGGESLFADGFALAAQLRSEAPEDFATLSGTAVPFLYRSQDAELYAERPLVQLSTTGAVTAVHYNSRSIAPLSIAAAAAPRFYGAYRRFAALMREARFQLRTRVETGTLVVFDNQRTLHGRTAFSSARHPRHLRGCYLSRDSVYSETALLRRRLAEVPG